MRRRKKQKTYKNIDLHGVKHIDAEIIVEEFILNNQKILPIDIITGHSEEMKKIVIKVLEYYGFEYEIGDFFNKGYIHVVS